jgi:hypothetical protein
LKTEGNFIYSIGNNQTKNRQNSENTFTTGITLAAAVNTIQTKNIAADLIVLKFHRSICHKSAKIIGHNVSLTKKYSVILIYFQPMADDDGNLKPWDRIRKVYCQDRIRKVYCLVRIRQAYCQDRIRKVYCQDRIRNVYCQDRVIQVYCQDRIRKVYCQDRIRKAYCQDRIRKV